MQENGNFKFVFDKKIKIVDNENMRGICMEFYFILNEKDYNKFIFA